MFILSKQDKENFQNNLFDYFKLFGKCEIGEVIEEEDLTIVYTGTPTRFNRVFRSRLNERKTDRKIAYVKDYFRERDSNAIWLIQPGDRPASLERKLSDLGFGKCQDWIDMFVNLEYEYKLLAVPDKFEIITVNSMDQLDSWIETMCSGFGFEQDISHYKTIFSEIGEDLNKNLKLYLGLYDDMPVSTCLSFFEHSVAGLQCISTIKGQRKKGFGSIITTHAMKDAETKSCKLIFLQSEQDARKIYENIGFKKYQRTRVFYI